MRKNMVKRFLQLYKAADRLTRFNMVWHMLTIMDDNTLVQAVNYAAGVCK